MTTNNSFDLFENKQKLDKLIQGLPTAFEIGECESPSGSPTVGTIRENILTGFFRQAYGKENVKIPISGVNLEYDLVIFQKPISIKTVSEYVDIKIFWAAKDEIAKSFKKNYEPKADIFLVTIWWGQFRESIYHIPLEVQRSIYRVLGDNYLKIGTGNNRGVSISTDAKNLLKMHSNTKKASVDWVRTGVNISPIDRWEKYWKEQ